MKSNLKQINREPIRFTKEGYEELKKTNDELLKLRPLVVEDLKKAREMGDLKENGYYKASRLKLNFVDSQLRRNKYSLQQAVIVEKNPVATIDIGSQVTLSEQDKKLIYHIVGDLESDPAHGKISLLSPLGRALCGKRVNDEISFETPKGVREFKIVQIE